MAKKYYAVKVGRKTGIFETWAEAESYVKGFANAKYKSFKTREEAQAYLDEGETGNTKIDTENSIQAYVDGSFSADKNIYGCGVVLLKDDEVIEKILATGNDKSIISMNNVAGELLGVVKAVEWAIAHNYEQIEIFYDYAGIENWVRGDWKADKLGTQKYIEAMTVLKEKINIVFTKVEAHSGVKYNELADQLAAQAIAESK